MSVFERGSRLNKWVQKFAENPDSDNSEFARMINKPDSRPCVACHKQKKEKIMKLQISSLLLMFILLSASFVMPVAASTTGSANVTTATANSDNFNYFFFGMKYTTVCYVSTQGGNLNVRNQLGAVIGRLPNGTRVNATIINELVAYVTAKVGRKTVRGYVAYPYLDCN